MLNLYSLKSAGKMPEMRKKATNARMETTY